MRLIDADVLELRIKALQEYGTSENNGRGWACNFLNDWQEPSTEWSVVESLIADIPTVDAAPVVHGKWHATRNVDDKWTLKCTACGTAYEELYYIAHGLRYCPGCGAKMDGASHGGVSATK